MYIRSVTLHSSGSRVAAMLLELFNGYVDLVLGELPLVSRLDTHHPVQRSGCCGVDFVASNIGEVDESRGIVQQRIAV